MRITIISGSPRPNSATVRVALALQNWLTSNSSHHIDLLDMRHSSLPPIKNVFTSIDKTPDELKPIAEKIFNSDAFILVTPEYNGSYSPALKNLLDHFPKQNHKTFGIVTASPGAFGGMRAAQQLLLLIPALFGIASPYLLLVPAVDKKFTPDGDLLDPSFENSIHNFITEFLWLSEKITEEKIIEVEHR